MVDSVVKYSTNMHDSHSTLLCTFRNKYNGAHRAKFPNMHDSDRHKCIIMTRQLLRPNVTKLQCGQMSKAPVRYCSMIESDGLSVLTSEPGLFYSFMSLNNVEN